MRFEQALVCVMFQEKLSSLVDSLCVEAVDKILKVVEVSSVKQEGGAGGLKDPPESEETSDSLSKPTEGELRTQVCCQVLYSRTPLRYFTSSSQ